MKVFHSLILMLVLCACRKDTSSSPNTEDPRSRKQVAGTVVTNTCNCTNPWSGEYPTIIQLDMPIGQELYVYSTTLEDSFRVPGEKIRFDLEFSRDSRRNWCNGITLPEEAQLSNVKFE